MTLRPWECEARSQGPMPAVMVLTARVPRGFPPALRGEGAPSGIPMGSVDPPPAQQVPCVLPT